MPCYRCGARQIDPARGPSPWRRGVRAGVHVLVCPDCQHGRDWSADLDRCVSCGSTMLLRALGETTCRGCGRVDTDDGDAAGDRGAEAPGLAEEVTRAIERMLRRGVG